MIFDWEMKGSLMCENCERYEKIIDYLLNSKGKDCTCKNLNVDLPKELKDGKVQVINEKDLVKYE